MKSNNFFKKITVCALIFAMIFSFSSCVKAELAEPEDMQRAAMDVVELLCEGKIKEAYEASTISLQYIYQYENFEHTWLSGVKYAGMLEENLGVVGTKWDGEQIYIVYIGVDFTEIGVIARFLFNEYGEMTSFVAYTSDFEDNIPLPDGVTEKDIVITTAGGLEVHGKITLPAGSGDVPGVVLIPGSGSVDMDCPYGKIKIMRDLAYGLAERGVASIRINKRTFETTQISSLSYSFEVEYYEDFSVAYELLADEPRVKSDSVFILGHSQGSLIAPVLDSRLGCAGLIILSGTNRNLWELAYDQNIQQLEINPNSDLLTAVNAEKEKASKLADQTALQAQQNSVFGANAYYYWFDANNRPDLPLVEKPVLLIRGLADYQTYDADWNSLITGYANAQLTTLEYEGLSHTLTPATGANGPADYFADERVSETVIDDIADFINK